jgi:glycosyltransferase involved in cell wall biosynthesis
VSPEPSPERPAQPGHPRIAIVAAHNEAEAIGATLDSLAAAMPGIELVVADDASADGTGDVALARGARLVRRNRAHGKGGNVGAAIESIHAEAIADEATILLCDGDLGGSAGELRRLVEAVEAGEADLAIAAFARRVGGGFGVALRFARWAIERRSGYRAGAPISGQRALRVDLLRSILPLAPGFGMEIGITVDAVRAGATVREYELPLEHRATFRTLRGFLHRARQLRDFARVYIARRRR